jgi:hypothetical protein
VKKLLLLSLLCVLYAPTLAHADLSFYIFPYSGQDPLTRYQQNDIVDIQPATGLIPVPNTSPFLILRVITTRTKAEVMTYLEKNATRRRAYYLDEAKMDSVSLAYWQTNRTITVQEATAISWLSKK